MTLSCCYIFLQYITNSGDVLNSIAGYTSLFKYLMESPMHPVIAKTFGGLSTQYYFRHLILGALLPALVLFMLSQGGHHIQIGMIVFFVINTLLYPYSRFVYESIIHFLIGENIFLVNAVLMLFVKLMTMAICWSAAIFIAPVGLAYLYFHHSKAND